MTTGLETLDPVNIGGLFGIGDQPALYFGCGDNNDFFSRDGGQHWGDPRSRCGDCDVWVADVATAERVVQFLPRRKPNDQVPKGFIGIVRGDGSEYPNAGDDDAKIFAQSPRLLIPGSPPALVGYAQSYPYLLGYRPLILTLATEAPPDDVDFIAVDQALDATAVLFRTTVLSKLKTLDDWRDTSKAQQIGPQLPPAAIMPQASGGHRRPVFYVGTNPRPPGTSSFFPITIFKLNAAGTSWVQIVPANTIPTPVKKALRWFVDPYDPNTIYVLDPDGVKISIDGGLSWNLDTRFTRAITLDGRLKISASLLQDMLFLRGERQTRFAFGTAGVFWTETFGLEWLPILNSIALPGRPEGGFFDALSNQSDRALYVECEGRSILRIGGIPGPPPFQPPPPFDLMTFAALEY